MPLRCDRSARRTKVLLVADIHANLAALKPALADMAAAGDFDRLQRRMVEAGLPRTLIERLSHGR